MAFSAQLLYPRLSYDIQGCVFEFYRQLGVGFAEAVYGRALLIELTSRGLHTQSEVPFEVFRSEEHTSELQSH